MDYGETPGYNAVDSSQSNPDFPPIYNFPPFFTRQLASGTWEAQTKFWQEIIFKEFRNQRQFILTPSQLVYEPNHPSLKIFTNKLIQRKLSQETLEEILQVMLKNGTATKLNHGKSETRASYIIWWRSREEWAELIYQWVQEVGAHNKVYLVADLIDDDEYSDLEFHGIHFQVMWESLSLLERSGRAKLIAGPGGSQTEAVKFAPS